MYLSHAAAWATNGAASNEHYERNAAMEIEIRSDRLAPDNIPDAFPGVEALEPIALSFDAYAHWGDRCGENAQRAARRFAADGTLPDDLADLRACLFYEHQRLRWAGSEPDRVEREYLQALLDAIRDALEARG